MFNEKKYRRLILQQKNYSSKKMLRQLHARIPLEKNAKKNNQPNNAE